MGRRVRGSFATTTAAAVALASALALASGACAARRARVAWPDAPVHLGDDADRDAAIDRLWVMPLGGERDRARAAIAAQLARRIAEVIDDDQPYAAAQLLEQLTWMWQADPTTIGRGLAPHADLLRRLRALFAKAGALEPTVHALVVLAELDPDQRAAHLAELDEVLGFADELARAEHGPDAGRAQPLRLLQPAVLALPLPWLVDRYVALLVERQRAVAELANQGKMSLQLVRAHADILATSRRIAAALARAGRTGEIHGHLARIEGLGADRELTARAETVAGRPAASDAYAELATALRGDDDPDAAAALAIGLAGLSRFPGDPELLESAGNDARALGRVDQAIALYERALAGSEEVDTTTALRLGKLYGDRVGRLASNGRPGAATRAWRDAVAFTRVQARRRPHVVWAQTVAIAEAALGKGLASQGLIADGRRALASSLERAPSIDALESLTAIDVQIDRFGDAQRWARAAIDRLGDSTLGDRYRKAKLERLAGDALRRAGQPRDAAPRYLDSLRSWASLGEANELPRAIAAERLIDSARSMWWLGDEPRAVDLVMAAVNHAPSAPAIPSSAVAFLIEVGRYRDALEALHRGLAEPAVGDLYKVYMSLWILGEGLRRGEPRDRLATEYLASRRGDTWYELLARAASGRLAFARLRAAATTGPRKGELAFYGAVLRLDPDAATPAARRKLLEQVVEARAVLDAEYDLARLYLAAEGEPRP